MSRSIQPYDFQGESPSLTERLVVSPTWGRLHHHRIREGRQLVGDSVIGEVRAQGGRVQLRLDVPGTFVRWIAGEGESVRRGHPVAVMRPDARSSDRASFTTRS